MATTQTAQKIPVAPPPTPAPPAEGGSYMVNEQTGEHTLVERTQPAGKE